MISSEKELFDLIITMQDISLLPTWDRTQYQEALLKNPLDQKMLKTKLEKIYQISSYNELQYVDEVLEAYVWIKLTHQTTDPSRYFANERSEKWFYEEFIGTAIRYMIICRRFQNLVMMVLTQQMMVQGLVLYSKRFDTLDKFPKTNSILKNVLEFDKQFFKLNYINNYAYIFPHPTQQEINQNDEFSLTLKPDTKVDVVKVDPHTRRFCWLPGTVKKITAINIHVLPDNDKNIYPFQKKMMYVHPHQSKKHLYEWRYSLAKGDQVDFQDSRTSSWVKATINQVRSQQLEQDGNYVDYELTWQDEKEWIGQCDPRIQKVGTYSGKSNNIARSISQSYLDDFNDLLLDPEVKSIAVARPEYCRSYLLTDLINYVHRELNLFERVVSAIEKRKFGIQVTADLVSSISQLHPLLHRQFALQYLPRLCQALLDYVNNADQITIRNFSKERFELVNAAITEFLKRTKSSAERKSICEELQLGLANRFLQSDFLDRKLYAVTVLTALLKQSKHRSLKRSYEELIHWIKEKGVLAAIYNEKSHSELISRSADFLQYYLLSQPTFEELSPLLEWNQSILKLLNDSYQYFPQNFREQLLQKIKSRNNVTNKDALQIVKRSAGCQSWLLSNGGQSWVSVVREKTKRKADIIEVFKYPFRVVEKITREVSQLYECKFKNEYFLQLHQASYLQTVLRDDSLPFLERVQFATLAIQPLMQIKDDLFIALAPYTRKIDELPAEAQTFFIGILSKLKNNNISQLFKQNFTEQQQLESIGPGQFALFKNCFLRINEQQRLIQRKIVNVYPTAHSYKKERRQILTIKANPNQLLGMKQLMVVVFCSSDLKITQLALEFIGYLFDHLSPELTESIPVFRNTFLQNCLSRLYSAPVASQQKYLRIIEGLLNESQKGGIDRQPSLSALFLPQTLILKLIDHFNVNKSRAFLEVAASLTLHELRAQIARHLNAYPHEVRLLLGDKQLDPRLNGHIIHTLNLTGHQLIAQRKVTVQKVGLCEPDGSLTQKCKNVLRRMFKQYSQCGLMSKALCQKYHQRCVGQVSSMSQSKVDKIYETYDTDKDGYLTEQNFIAFYEQSAKSRQLTVWSNLQTFGIRNDLQDLRQLQITYPEPNSLVRHLLFNNSTFMALLIQQLQASQQRLAQAAWKVASRLPLINSAQFFNHTLDLNRPLLFRYWLYEVISSQKWELLTLDILQRLLNSDIQTTCIGLRAAINSPHFQVNTFHRIIINLKKINSNGTLSFHSQVVLDNTLRILEWLLRENQAIRAHFSQQHSEYDAIITSGLMSKNVTIRKMYCEAVERIMLDSAQNHFQIFEPFFRLVYGNFEKCDKATLSIEYFDLYSQLLEILKEHQQLLPKLELNWLILAQSMIGLFLAHKSTESGLNSPPDQVAQGYLRILRKMFDSHTLLLFVPLVSFLFQKSLFPDSGQNKLKNSKSRHQAYELLHQICSMRDQKGNSPGLNELFAAGFKNVYKKMSANKTSSYGFSSYFYSYNQARSQLGYAGIRNLGCICYMIAMLQQLFMTQSFRSLVLMADDGQPECLVKKGTKQVDDNIFHQLQAMFANLQLTERQDYTPDEFCFAFKDFQGQPVNVSIQQDSQEFLNIFFDKIETALKPTPFRHIVEDIFGGKIANQTVCSNCKAVNQRLQNFYPLSLQIKGFKNIDQSFKKLIQGEVISDYQCDACKKKADVTKSCLLAKVPNYFIIHFQRICFNYDKFQNEKVNSRLEFPNNLNVYNYTLDKQKGLGDASDYQYTLKGIVLHYGSAQFGHYFSYIKQSENRWIEFNDERVRQFDPHDIEVDCFGGEHWRRESQSAYLLLYEKVKKTPIRLEFENNQQQSSLISKFSLSDSVYHKTATIEQETKNEKAEEMIETEQKDEKIQKQDNKEQGKQAKKQQQKITLQLDPQNIPSYIPETFKQKISKANEEFSFTLNLSNDQFAHFLHKVLTIDPPANLTTQFLELCYECFHLRTMIDETQGLSLAEWAARRFKQIIGGHGWQFLKIFGQNWQSDILSIERSTRIGIKNLLQCVISDIIVSAQKQQDSTQKDMLVRSFLQKYTTMLNGEVGKNWTRFREYFEVWTSLISESQAVRKWCQEMKMVERLLDFIMQEYSPFAKGHKKYSLRNMHYGAQFQHPLEMLTLLLREGYMISEAERQCMRHYAFIEKAIKYPTPHFNIVQYLCKDDRPLSQKFAYLILVQTNRVTQSDEVKPIVAAILRFVEIKDQHQKDRINWLIGFPQYCQNPRTNSYGIFGIYPQQDAILNFVSPIRALPLPQLLFKFKNKLQHVACLLFTLLLQLEAQGYINNLDEFPSPLAFTSNYTYWGENFVDSYYQETHRAYIAKYYTEYGDRLKSLWQGRPNRPYNHIPHYLIGRTVAKETVKQVQINEYLEVEYMDVTSKLLQITEENNFLSKRNIKNFAGSQDFRVKLTTHYGGTGFLSIDRGNQSSDDDQNPDKPTSNPFDKAFQGVLFRKIVIKNQSSEGLLMVLRIKSPIPEPNFEPSNFQVSFELKSELTHVITLKKQRIDEPFGEYTVELKVLGAATKDGYWPRQLITEIPQQRVEEDKDSSDNEQELPTNVWTI